MCHNRKILLLGAGGHCLSVIDSLISSNCYTEIGIIDKVEEGYSDKRMIMGVPVVGSDDDLLKLFESGYTDAFITVGSIGDPSLRRKLYQRIKEIGFQIPNIIDKTSVVSACAKLDEGIYVGKNAVINANATIGSCAIINTSTTIEHECHIGEFAHIAPGSILCGNVNIGDNTHIGAGSKVKQGIHIGSDTMIGMGSVVVTNIGCNVVAYGNPCKEVR
ncbi:MAG: acetyltransferase [Bacteroidales bacterium]|nr:acetyltransferase [Bacteroidales bacterium]